MVRLKNFMSVSLRENYINPTHIYYGKIPIFCCGCYQADPNVTISMLHNNNYYYLDFQIGNLAAWGMSSVFQFFLLVERENL